MRTKFLYKMFFLFGFLTDKNRFWFGLCWCRYTRAGVGGLARVRVCRFARVRVGGPAWVGVGGLARVGVWTWLVSKCEYFLGPPVLVLLLPCKILKNGKGM